jgi:hypothetical protein
MTDGNECAAPILSGIKPGPCLLQDKQVPHGLTVSAILKRGVNLRCSGLLPPEGDLIHSTDSIQCGIVRHGRPVVCQPAGSHETDHENCVDNREAAPHDGRTARHTSCSNSGARSLGGEVK